MVEGMLRMAMLVLLMDLTEVSIFTTPGKPMALDRPNTHAETITARKSGQLVVARNVKTPDQGYREYVFPLSKQEWEEIAEIVRANKLTEWAAQLTGEQAYDFSSFGFSFTRAGGAREVRSWHQPISNGAQPRALFDHLGTLARKKLGRPHFLFYLHHD